MKNIVICGIQGSGKWTQSKKILEYFEGNIGYLEMGQILRSLMKTENGIWVEIKQTVDSGNLVDPGVTVGLFQVFLAAIWDDKFFLADGFPRETVQYEAFHEIMEKAWKDYLFLELVIDEEACIKRIQSRKICSVCGETFSDLKWDMKDCSRCGGVLNAREDDKDIETIKGRMNIFKNSTQKVIDSAEKKWKLVRVNWDQDPAKVFEDILKVIKDC